MGKINQATAQAIIDEYCCGASSYDLADKYGLWQTSICNIIGGRTWLGCRRPENIKEIVSQRHEKGLYEKGRICHIEAPPLTEMQTDILVGSMLGDGNIGVGKVNCEFRKKQRNDRKEYLDWHFDKLQPYGAAIDEVYSKEKLIGGKSGVILERRPVDKFLSGYSFRTHQHPVFKELRQKWYKNRTKVIPIDLHLSPLSVAIWYCDDGHNCQKQRWALFCTESFTFDEAEILCGLLAGLGVSARIQPKVSGTTGKKQPQIKVTKSSYDNLIELVRPLVPWKCFAHKLEWRRAKKQWEYSSGLAEEQAMEIKNLRKTKSAAELAEMFGVHVNTIYAIVSGRSWKHLPQG